MLTLMLLGKSGVKVSLIRFHDIFQQKSLKDADLPLGSTAKSAIYLKEKKLLEEKQKSPADRTTGKILEISVAL